MLLASSLAGVASAAEGRSGEQVYREMCARCHGPHGEGVIGKHEEALGGDKSLESLRSLVERTMPEDEPGTCKGDDAKAVAAYLHERFYSADAQARRRPARIEFSRLTVRQYRNSVADLVGSFRGATEPPEPGGLKAEYFAAKGFNDKKRAIERTDPAIEFAFGEKSPDEKLIAGPEFAIRWQGSILIGETGTYEFVVKSENGVRLWVNGGERRGGGEDSTPSGSNGGEDRRPLIDEWVSSGAEPREHRASVFLLGGRAYPIKLETFRFKDKTASIALKWKPPHGTVRTIPAEVLSPKGVPESVVVTAVFPPDDGSAGYERGTSVSKAWEQAVTAAAVEAANKVVERIDELTRSTPGDGDRAEKLKAFAATFAGRAFRRPLTDAERAFFRDKPFEGAAAPEAGVKRAVLLVLMSPRYLYPQLGGGAEPDGFTVASRLALDLWDSLPDRSLLDAAKDGKLASADAVGEHAKRMLADPRARAKVRDFLHLWLNTEEAEDISKDPATFPDFNPDVLADLRTSLDLFLDDVVWGDGDYRRLLLASDLYLNDRLAKFLGAKPPDAAGFTKVGFDPAQRSGVLTHPYLLAALAYNKNSSPIHRGVFLTRNIVGRSLKPPPQAVSFVEEQFDPSFTMRQKITELTRSANCMGCHAVINPLGFSLEHYDAVGRFRETENNKPVDASSEYPAPDGTTVRIAGARDVAQLAAASPDAHRAFIRQLFNHLVKQPPEAYGPDVLESLRKSFTDSNFNVRSLVVEIAKVSALHRAKGPASEPAS